MSKIEITRDELDTAVDVANVDLREGYSGRGMYGETCIGVTGDDVDCQRFEAELAKATTLSELGTKDADPQDVLDLYMGKLEDIQCARRTDNMGLDMIYYYPRVKLEG